MSHDNPSDLAHRNATRLVKRQPSRRQFLPVADGDLNIAEQREFWERSRDADAAFQAAMVRAGAKRHLHQDDTTIVGTRFERTPVTSGCSSSAGLCADFGEGAGA